MRTLEVWRPIRTIVPWIDSDSSGVVATHTGLGTTLCFFLSSEYLVSTVVLVIDSVTINCVQVKGAISLVYPYPILRPQLFDTMFVT